VVKRFPCEETTLDFWHSSLRIRLWVTNDEGLYSPETMMDYVLSVLDRPPYEQSDVGTPKQWCVSIAERIAYSGMLNLAAVQVIDEDHQPKVGHMIYTVGFD
jgi:hypothetical protein